MEAEEEWEREQRVREMLEEIAKNSNITDTVLVPLMQANKFDVSTCVEVLLEMINEQSSSVEQEQRDLEEELEFFRNCQMEASQEKLSSPVSAKGELISAELARTAELEARRREAETEEKLRFAQMRKDLEAEWMARLQQQQADLAARQQAMEEERRRVMDKQLLAVAQERSAEFKAQVEEALKKRLADGGAPAQGVSASSDKVEVEITCPESAEMGSKMTVYWEYKRGRPSMSDWIGYFKRSRSDQSRAYYVYQKTGGSEKGKLEFVVPSKLGICEVRMFQNNSYTIIARSKPIRVGNNVAVEAHLASDGQVQVKCVYANKSQASSWDWVALFASTSDFDSDQYIGSYVYLTSENVQLAAPKKPGSYVVRYFQSGSGKSALAQSNVLEIPDNDWIKAVVTKDGVAEVSWHIESVANRSHDRVALHREGDNNPLAPLAVQLTHSTKPEGVAKFSTKGIPTGSYQIWFIPNGTAVALKKSAPFKIE